MVGVAALSDMADEFLGGALNSELGLSDSLLINLQGVGGLSTFPKRCGTKGPLFGGKAEGDRCDLILTHGSTIARPTWGEKAEFSGWRQLDAAGAGYRRVAAEEVDDELAGGSVGSVPTPARTAAPPILPAGIERHADMLTAGR